jgi:hypothetical protein
LKRVRETAMLDTEDGIHEITVEINSKTIHTVPMIRLREWRDSNSGSPRENGTEIEFALRKSEPEPYFWWIPFIQSRASWPLTADFHEAQLLDHSQD